jgi:hypothetical protein
MRKKSLLSSEKTSTIALTLCEVFNYDIFESVIFVDEEHITFGVVLPTPFQSQKNEWFNDTVVRQFNKKFA